MRSVRYIALIITAALLACMCPAEVFAGTVSYDVWVNGVRITENNAAGIKCGMGTAVYSSEQSLLTITDTAMTKLHEETDANGVHCAPIFALGDLTVEVYGENTVTSSFSMGHNVLNCGIWCGGTLTIKGSGTLTVTGGLSTFRTVGIYAAEIVMEDSVIVNANGGRLTSSVDTCGYGICAEGDITFTDNATAAAISFLPDSDYLPAVSAAICVGETLTVRKNASVRSIANRSAEEAGDAVLVRGSVAAEGGSLRARAVGENGCGIRISSNHPSPLTVSNGFIFASGGAYAVFSSYGKFAVHPEYRVTGSAAYNASEAGCDASSAPVNDGGIYYALTTDSGAVPARTVYFVRPVIAYGLWVGGVQVTNYNCGDILGNGKAAYDVTTSTLSLNGAQIGGERYNNAYLYAEDPLIVSLAEGSANTLGGFSHEPTESAYGIYAAKGLTITGGGSLTVASGDALTDAFGVYVRIGALCVNGAVLQTKAGNAAGNSAGIYVASSASGDLAVSQMASVSATSGRAATMVGISANGSISVTEASSVYGEGGSNKNEPDSVSYGVRSGGAMDMDDSSTVKGIGGDCAKFSIGVYALGSKEGITVRGGKLIAISGEGADRCYGLYSKATVSVKRGDLEAESAEASDSPGSLSYAVTGRTVQLSGGNVAATAGKASASCGIYADSFTVSGTSGITAASFNGPNSHAMRKMPKYVSYAPVVYAGSEAPGELIAAPTEAAYVNHPYVRIEKLFRSEKVWYALPIYDSAGRFAARWVGFTSDDVTKLAEIGAGVEGTGAAEYYNGYIYGVTNALPFRFWRVKIDGATIGAPEFINDSVRFSFGDMSYDYVTDKMYGLGTFNAERAVFSIDLQTGESKRAASISGTDAELLTMAFNREGDCYGIDLAGYLYRIYLINGKAEKIGFTGLVPDGAQSMSFDRSTNELFWAYYNGQTGRSGFYYVDITTGEAVAAGNVGGAHMELAGLFTIPQSYDIWVGGVRVNEENAKDVFGNRLVSFDAEAKTLTFNGMKITTYAQAYKNYSFGILVKDMDIDLIFNGENAIAMDGVYTEHSASICVVNGRARIEGGKLTILNTTARLDNTILCPDGLTVENCELMVYSNHNAITVNSEGADVLIRDSAVGIHAGHIGMAATNGRINVQNSTVAITADKDDRVRACAAAALDCFVLDRSTFIATADTNIAVIAAENEIRESTLEITGAEQALSGATTFIHKNGTAVTVANGKTEDSKKQWDKTTALTNYNYIRIAECTHEYDSDSDTECNICGHIRYVTPGGEFYVPGDADGDGRISSADARLALRRSVQLEDYPETSAAYYACDADFDGKVTSGDARLILRASVGLEEIA